MLLMKNSYVLIISDDGGGDNDDGDDGDEEEWWAHFAFVVLPTLIGTVNNTNVRGQETRVR